MAPTDDTYFPPSTSTEQRPHTAVMNEPTMLTCEANNKTQSGPTPTRHEVEPNKQSPLHASGSQEVGSIPKYDDHSLAGLSPNPTFSLGAAGNSRKKIIIPRRKGKSTRGNLGPQENKILISSPTEGDTQAHEGPSKRKLTDEDVTMMDICCDIKKYRGALDTQANGIPEVAEVGIDQPREQQ